MVRASGEYYVVPMTRQHDNYILIAYTQQIYGGNTISANPKFEVSQVWTR